MDKNISEAEALNLKEHIEKCERCYEDFLIYDELLTEFSAQNNIINAPEELEAAVMEKIYSIGDIYKKYKETNVMLYAAWGSASALCGIGMLLNFNKNAVADYLYSIPIMKGYAEHFAAVESFVLQFKANAIQIISSFIDILSSYVQNFKPVSLVVFIALILAQIIIYKKDRAEAK